MFLCRTVIRVTRIQKNTFFSALRRLSRVLLLWLLLLYRYEIEPNKLTEDRDGDMTCVCSSVVDWEESSDALLPPLNLEHLCLNRLEFDRWLSTLNRLLEIVDTHERVSDMNVGSLRMHQFGTQSEPHRVEELLLIHIALVMKAIGIDECDEFDCVTEEHILVGIADQEYSGLELDTTRQFAVSKVMKHYASRNLILGR